MIFRLPALAVIAAAALTFGVTGCSGPTNPDASHDHDDHSHDGHDHDHEGHDHGDHKDEHSHSGHTHGEWWCAEHGVPEEECGQCQPKVADALKKQGDWCEDHNRPDSQCFICHPELEAKFAARYEAKYGKATPKMN